MVSLSIIFFCFFDDNDDDDGSTIEDSEPLDDIERVSFAFDRSETDGDSWACSISSDGRFVAFSSDSENLVENDSNGFMDVFIVSNPINQ